MQYLTDTSDLVMQRGAQISDCGTYRYRLWREWDRCRPTLAFLMLIRVLLIIRPTTQRSPGACREQ